MTKLTIEHIKIFCPDACDIGLTDFTRKYPDGIEVTEENIWKAIIGYIPVSYFARQLGCDSIHRGDAPSKECAGCREVAEFLLRELPKRIEAIDRLGKIADIEKELELTPEVRRIWAQALLSSKYRQGARALCMQDNNGNRYYCCLGVLCDLANPNSWGAPIIEWGEEHNYNKSISFERPNMAANIADPSDSALRTVTSLAPKLNDSGMSFAEIANILMSSDWEIQLQDAYRRLTLGS